MYYVNRFLNRGSGSSPSPPSTHTRPHTSPVTSHHHTRRSQSRKAQRHNNIMVPSGSFQGPEFNNLVDFYKCIQNNIPSEHKDAFYDVSKKSIEKICDQDALHVWESDGDLDNLLQLTAVIVKLCKLGVRMEEQVEANKEGEGSMLIITEEKPGRDNFARICELVRYLTSREGTEQSRGTIWTFSSIIVVRGVNNTQPGAAKEAYRAITRINKAIERGFTAKKIVWHHGPVISFLLQWINTTKPHLRKMLSAITITGAIDLAEGVEPSPLGRPNTVQDMQRLEGYARTLGIEVVWLDTGGQLITYEYLATYMYFFGYYINTFLPSILSRPHLHKAQDELILFAFRLRGASQRKYGNELVQMVQEHLDPAKAKRWARLCIDASNYTKEKCREAGKDNHIHHAVQLADSPFALFHHGNTLPAFSRLAIGPTSISSTDYYLCPPVSFNFTQSKLRVSHPSPFRILLPAPGQNVEKVTAWIQGLMMAVLERVRQEKGMPNLGDEERAMWKEVVRACTWAIEGCEGKCPKGVEEKVGFVKEKLRKGVWGYALGVPTGNGGN